MEQPVQTPDTPVVDTTGMDIEISHAEGGTTIDSVVTPETQPQVEPQATPEAPKTFEDGDGNKYTIGEDGKLVKQEGEPQATPEAEPEVNPEVAQLEQQLIDMHKNSIFGSDAEYQAAIAWGAQNMSDAEQRLYNQVVESGTPAEVAFAMKSLHAMAAQHTAANAPAATPKVQDGQTVHPSTTAQIGLQPFANDTEMQAAMSDPRYHRSDAVGEAYRQQIIQRMALS